MMRVGHHVTGLAAGVFVAGLLHHMHPSLLWPDLLAIAVAGWFGGVAPDHLEYIPLMRIPWVPHRTFTHWGILWVVAFAWALILAARGHALGLFPAAVLGFTLGGLIHLICDWPNPTGVPWFWPTSAHRHSLRLWRSGEHDFLISASAAAASIVPWIAR